MQLPQRRTVLKSALAATAAAAGLAAPAVRAQQAPVRLVVPYPPGGSADGAGRLFALKMSDVLGRQVVVDNRPGGGTVIASEYVARAAPDGTTVMQINPSHLIVQAAMKNLSFHLARDFVPVSLIASTPMLLVVTPSLPAQNVRELVALAKAKPGTINYASGGIGGITHLTTELFKRRAGIDMVHVTYKGVASTVQAVVTGDTPVAINDLPTYLPLVKAGKVRALAVLSEKRAPDAPDLPTMAEAGVPGVVSDVWYGLLAPKGTPRELVASLNAAATAAAADAATRERARTAGLSLTSSTPEQFGGFLSAEIEKWAQLVKDVDLKL
ncbi:tripartite tricarboxylate transporter substrate binding protein [Ramlibacter sp.]|uniref:tripartite tricarboxylate transporter substrate binding protein n=1 Tax=Ramlibacter sp. TaxID=1917967 RepID=UPI003D0E10F0